MDNFEAEKMVRTLSDMDTCKGPLCPKCARPTRGVLGFHVNYFRCHYHAENFREVDGALVPYPQGVSPDVGTPMKEEYKADRAPEKQRKKLYGHV